MRASAHHHCGLRVVDIDRAAQFYIAAFDGRFLAKPFQLEGDFAETVMEGPPGVSFKVCMVGFTEGCVELFRFVNPAHAIEPVHTTRGDQSERHLDVLQVRGAAARARRPRGDRQRVLDRRPDRLSDGRRLRSVQGGRRPAHARHGPRAGAEEHPRQPLRPGEPEEVARLVVFLAGDDSSMMTGSCTTIDLGTLAWRGMR
jgi:catechol 2,3-dioxygenase-like lactoylglutathione lyase family enzyme